MEKAAAFQLLSLRKQCISEGLGDTLELVMSETGVFERDFERWESLTIQGPIGQQRLQLGEHKDLDPGEQRQDRITRINEWMLGVLLTTERSFHLHRRIMDLELKKWRESASRSHIHNWEEHIYGGNIYEAARRTIVKF